MKKQKPVPKGKIIPLTKEEIAAQARSIKCAGWIAIRGLGLDNGKAELELYSFIIIKMTAIAMGLLKDGLMAKEAFSKAWEDILKEIDNGHYKEQNIFEAYSRKIITNICFKILKGTKRFDELDEEGNFPNPEAPQSKYSDEMKAYIKVLMLECTVIMQDKITMHYIDGDDWNIVGKKYNISADTVRGEVSKKMRQFKKKLGG